MSYTPVIEGLSCIRSGSFSPSSDLNGSDMAMFGCPADSKRERIVDEFWMSCGVVIINNSII